ncbi:hypothetical protein JR316_0008083 [Psilocybe cubensis]|uniref:Uncharacterized protein n=2 Tax=Psilocybe cubensis TaxID=181762 RepID=A0ACB8GVI6_PSICU|nr:hypothetical protein JR316_0008083 [Psilocybe cubensis]KAH9479489.1 hypothetical protein JR316_0008083 [Psilocybe cubensis]
MGKKTKNSPVSSVDTMGNSTTDINVSLEPHLIASLQVVYPLLPHQLAQELCPFLSDPPPAIIPYNVLYALSQWARTEQSQTTLRSKGLEPHAFSMISLLAGTITSPERKFGDYVPPKEPEDIAAERIRERKAITVLLNALLSIAGVAFAAWWAADKTGWANEWRVLFALFAAIVVALAEAVLYIIWQSRQSKSPKARRRLARHKKVDQPPESNSTEHSQRTSESESVHEKSTLRQRRP